MELIAEPDSGAEGLLMSVDGAVRVTKDEEEPIMPDGRDGLAFFFAFRAGAFLAAAIFAATFLAGAFFAAAFLTVLWAEAFLATVFFATFFATFFTVFLAATFFFAAGFL